MKQAPSDEQRLWPVILLFVLLMTVSVFAYKGEYDRTLKENAYASLKSFASYQSALVSQRIEGQFSVLASSAYILSDDPSLHSVNSLVKLNAIADSSDFTSMAIAAPNGIAMMNSTRMLDIGQAEYFQKSLSGSRAIEPVLYSLVGPKVEHFALSVPIFRAGKVIGVLCGYYPKRTFIDLLSADTYGNSSRSLLADSAGDVIVSGREVLLSNEAKNFIDYLESESAGSSFSLDGIREDLLSGRSGAFDFYASGLHRYASYSPLGINDWFILNIVDGTTAEAAVSVSRRLSTRLGVHIFSILLLLMSIIYLREHRRRQLAFATAERLRISEERYRILEDLSDNVFFEGSIPDDTLEFNSNYEKIFGMSPPAKTFRAFLLENEAVYHKDRDVFRNYGLEVLSGKPMSKVEFRLSEHGGELPWFCVESVTLFSTKNEPHRVIGKITNIDETKRTLLRLQTEAEHDALTNLYNRSALTARVDGFLSGGGAHGPSALFMLDIDHFKAINDTFGHLAGDMALKALADALRTCFRASDPAARLGGDEFIMFMGNASSIEVIERHANRIMRTVEQIQFQEYPELHLSCSIGIAVFPEDGTTFDQLYRRADSALYTAKNGGRGRFARYMPGIDASEGK